jgi:hypothetical protein
MSLNVWLTMPGARLQKEISGIFIRENGQVKEITREEWNDRNPDHVPTVANFGPEETEHHPQSRQDGRRGGHLRGTLAT